MSMTQVRAEQLKGVAKQFPPLFTEITPNFITPNVQIEATIRGEFFTPDMTVTGNGFTVNNIIFIDTKTVKLFIVSAGVDGIYGITLDNNSGTPTTKSNVFTVSQGNVIIPTLNDWTFVSPIGTADLNAPGEVKITASGQSADVIWNQEFDMSRKWRLVFSFELSPFNSEISWFPTFKTILLLNSSDNSIWSNVFSIASSSNMDFRHLVGNQNFVGLRTTINDTTAYYVNVLNFPQPTFLEKQSSVFATLEWDLIDFKWYSMSNQVTAIIDQNKLLLPPGNLKLRINANPYNVDSIKYIELP